MRCYQFCLILAAALLAAGCGQDAESPNNNDPIVIGDTGGEDAGGTDGDGGAQGDVGTEADQGESCDDACSTDGATRCDGDNLETCTATADGCLGWEQTEVCSGELFCSAGQCVSQCQDACSTVGARRCEAGGAGTVSECQTDANGCLVWAAVETCAGIETCSNGACAEQCSDECGAVNDRACEGDGYKLCGNFDNDPCLDWGDAVPCNGDATCSSGYCAVQCTDECSTGGVDACVMGSNAKHTCGDFDADPCLEWGTTINCAADETCESGACMFDDPCAGVSCNSPPADTCVDPDTARQYGVGTCNATGGCDYGYVDTHCPDGCQNGACVAPTCGGTLCNSPPADTCASSAELTRYFPVGSCDATDMCVYATATIECSNGCFQGTCIDGSWETEIPPLSVSSSTVMDITFDATGSPHIAYCTKFTGDIYYRWRDASGWHEEIVDPALGYTQQSSCEVAIGLDAHGRPMIAYHDPTNADLRFARKESGMWNLDLVATTGFVGLAPSVTVNPGGAPVVGYLDETADELILATLSGGTWSMETVAAWTAWADPITEMRWSRTGDLHILAGGSRSIANPQNTYNQPELYLHTRSGGNWTSVTLHEDAFTSRDGLALAPNGDIFVQAGVVRAVGSNDEMVVIRSDGAQVLDEQQVRSFGNLLYLKPIGVMNTDTMLEVVMDEPFHYRLDDHGYWVQRQATPVDSQGMVLRAMWELGDDNYRLLHPGWRITTPAACTPECSGRTCGNDGCGGVCGTCAAGQSCDPLGQCSDWNYETPEFYADKGAVAMGTHEVHTFGYASNVNGPMMYSNNVGGVWTTVDTGVDDPMAGHSYAEEPVVDSAGNIHVATVRARPTHYNAWDKIEVFSQGPMGWMTTEAGELFQSGQPIDFAIDQNGVWHFAISERRYPDYSGSQLAYVKYENGTSTKEVITTPKDPYNRGNGYAYQTRLVLDSNGHAHILWIQTLSYTNQTSLRYATNASGSWVDVEVLDPFNGSLMALEIDSNDMLHVSYTASGNNPFQYGTYDVGNQMWSWEDGPFNYAWDQFGLDPSGTPFVTNGATEAVEIYRRVGPGNWAVESIPVYRSGSPQHVLFDDASNLHLIYRAGGGYAQYQTRHVWR